MHIRFAVTLIIRALFCCLLLRGGAGAQSQTLRPNSLHPTQQSATLPTVPSSAATQVRVAQAFGKTPRFFERNQGQIDEQAKFMARGAGYGLFLTATEAVLSLRKEGPKQEKHLAGMTQPLPVQGPPVQPVSAVLRMQLVGGNRKAHVKGLAQMPGKSHYFIGNDESKWHTDVAHFGQVKYAQVYRGIDLIYYGNQNQLEYDFLVAPRADPSHIRMRFEGAQKLEINTQGELVLHTRGGPVVQRAPVLYQEVNGERRRVAGRYKVLSGREVGFAIGEYDPHRPLVIDPVIAFSTYIGGSGRDQGGHHP